MCVVADTYLNCATNERRILRLLPRIYFYKYQVSDLGYITVILQKGFKESMPM